MSPPTDSIGLTYIGVAEVGNGDTVRCYECPECGEPICQWTDCPKCEWYDEDVWEKTVAEGWP